ncbi:formimidoylglutamase [Lutibacter holmesii]|uniref:Formimidoylglutamase n=1 Tax=Lutibacter holmesii TaxID=1137985 RepID=A0ABW3WNP7_9FLAO
MNFDYLKPVKDDLLARTQMRANQNLGQSIEIYTSEKGFPNLDQVKIAIVGVLEGRASEENFGVGDSLDAVRTALYELFPGNWPVNVADLGDIQQGNTIQDTYFAVKQLLSYLIKRNIIPVIIGGGQDLTYANYRAYDELEQTVNLVAVDSKFDLGSIESELSSTSYLSRIVMDQPANLFNFSNIGYQTYFNAQEEIDLLESLYFEAYRLGEVSNSMPIVEPVLRDADIVSVDLSAVKNSEAPANNNASPNGFTGAEICAISRYAGISDKVTSFGIYEYNAQLDSKNQTAQLISQMIWYFIEGVNYRANDYPFGLKDRYQKYIVPIEDQLLNFHKSNKSGRWWMEIALNESNKFKRHTLIPCTYEDYISATNQEIPERWIRTLKKIV